MGKAAKVKIATELYRIILKSIYEYNNTKERAAVSCDMSSRFSIDIGNRIPNAPLTKLYLPTGKKIKYEYDSLNRLKEKGIVTDTAEYYSELYTYGEGGYHEESVTGVFRGPSATTIKPDRETTFVSEVEFRGLSITDKYEYDLHGNISKKVTGGKEIRYIYDDAMDK